MLKLLMPAIIAFYSVQSHAVDESLVINYNHFVLSEEVRSVLEDSVQTYCFKSKASDLEVTDVQVEKISIDQGKNDYYFEVTLNGSGGKIVAEILDFSNDNPAVNSVVLNGINCFALGDQ